MLVALKFVALVGLVSVHLPEAASKEWWETASFYQIYPRSFKDSNGDGTGDLRGITQQLDYLKEIGVTATWLSPIFTSPMADFGYDVANFTEIDPIFGNMDDFDALVEKANTIGIKIILDFVPNHSSDECDWFVRSVNGDPEYKDFYVWHPGKMVNGERQPPTNWISNFRRSMWTWNEKRQAYYLHQFHYKQPDLNYRNPVVVEVMKENFRFWLRRGVAGFRVDATPYIFEVEADAAGNWPDEERNEAVNDPEDYEYLQHFYTSNRPETVELMYEFRKTLDEMTALMGGDQRIMLTEAYAPIDVVMQYYGNDITPGVQIPFNFELISNLKSDSNAYHYAQLINGWMDNMPEGKVANWVMGNHDNSRIGSRMGEDRIDTINALLLTLPGCSVTYMGEELGMLDVWISWNDTVDPQACQSNPEDFERLTRDPNRTPFYWNDAKFAGFTEGDSTWLPVSDDYKLCNVKRERGISRSHLNIFKQLRSLRNEPTMKDGQAEVKALSENVLAIKRYLEGHPSYVILLNINDDVEPVNLHAAFTGLSADLEYVIVTAKSPRRPGDKSYADSILLMPKETAILRTT